MSETEKTEATEAAKPEAPDTTGYFERDAPEPDAAKAGDAEPEPEPEPEDGEGGADAEPEKPAQEPRYASKMAALRKERRKVDDRLAQVDARLAELARRERAVREAEDLITRDPLEYARTKGRTMRDIIEQAAREDEMSPEQRQIRELKTHVDALTQRLEERQANEQSRAEQSQADADCATLQSALEATGEDEFPACKAFGADRSARIVYQRWVAAGGRLQPEEIYDTIEAELAGEYQRLHERLARVGTSPDERPETAATKTVARNPSRENGAGKSAEPERQRKPSLTNRTAASKAAPEKPLSQEDRFSRAVALLTVND